MISVVLKPKLLSIKNRWRTNRTLKGQFGRDLILGCFSIAVMLSIYFGLQTALMKTRSGVAVAYLHPGMILDLLLIFLYGLLVFSAAISTIGILFLSDDMAILRASPISKPALFTSKLLEAISGSTWMVVVFGLPGLVAFGTTFHGGLSFYALAIVAMIPYFVIPAAGAITLITLFAAVIPANRTKEVLIGIGIVFMAGIYFLIRLLLGESNKPMENVEDLLHIVQMLRAPNAPWLPTHWAATVLGQTLAPSGIPRWPYMMALWGLAGSLVASAYTVFALFYDRAYTMAQGGSSSSKMHELASLTDLPPLSWIYSQEERALLSKEMSTFLRDMSQSVQLMLLLALCSLYLYNLRILRVVDQLPENARVWWQSFLIIGNMAMGAFVIAAVCTRFVFPSISLEGRAYWILRSSPLPLWNVLKAKFKIWYLPVCLIGTVLLLSGALAIQADPIILLVSGIISWIVSIGIVGLAVGLGSAYANFDWEHASQLAASFGSLVYMLCSTIFIGINLIPITMLLLIKNMKILNYEVSDINWYLSIVSCLALLLYLNLITARWAIRVGEQSLKEREK